MNNFMGKLFQAINMIPFFIQGAEAIFGAGNGGSKKDKVKELFNFAAGITNAIANQDIIDAASFDDGIKMVNDGVVKMLNASVWHGKPKTGV